MGLQSTIVKQKVINGEKTQVIIVPCVDNMMVTVTQNGKLGCVLETSYEELSNGNPSIEIATRSGRRDNEMFDVLGRYLTMKWKRSIVLTVQLNSKSVSLDNLHEITAFLDEIASSK